MIGQKYWEDKVPVYTEINEIREQRKQRFLKEAEEFYPTLEKITREEYAQIKASFESGNENAKRRLMEISIAPIIDALAGIYAKYDIEEVVPFEEGLSHVLETFNKNLNTFDKLPRFWSEYSVSMINFYVYSRITFHYKKLKNLQDNIEIMPQSKLTWQIDKTEHEDFSYKHIAKEEIRKRIIKIMSKLETRQARVLALRYGLFDGCERTYEEISKLEGNICRSRVEQIAKAGLIHIRKPKNSKQLKVYADADLDLIN